MATTLSPSEAFNSIKPTMLDGLKVLFVDDDADVLHLVKTLLGNAHAEVVTATSGREALALLDSVHPDVIVSDISMPGFDGYDFITTIRNRKITTPAIALTAQTRTKDHDKAIAAGFNVHLRKPMRALTLIAAISQLVHP